MTAPVEVPVVLAAKRPEAAGPKRTSLPSMFPPVAWISGLPCSSNAVAARAAPIQRTNIAAKSTQPWRRSFASLPKVNVSANGIISSAHISRRFVSPLGFSYGCAELAFIGPPPFVPSSLIAS